VTAVLWFVYGLGVWVVIAGFCDMWRQWQRRRRPVRDSRNRWRMP
jgi:hypothetical protein